MSVYAKQLHYIKDGAQNDIKLYTSLSDVVDVNINPDGTTGGITLYTSPQDVGYENPTLSLYTSPDDTDYPCARLMDGDTPVYVSLEELTSSNANVSGLRMSAGGTTYIVNKNALPIKGKSSYTPAEIKEILDAGKHTEYFNVGDSILSITLNGTVEGTTFTNQTIKAKILGFDHNKATETNGKSSITFGIADTEGTDISLLVAKMNSSNTNSGGWNGSYMRTTVCNAFYNALPSDLQSVIGSVTKYSDNTGGGSDTASYVTTTKDKIFLLSEYEVFGTRTYANSAEQNYQQQYDYYKDGVSKIRHLSGSADAWWLRSPRTGDNGNFCVVTKDGGPAHGSSSLGSYGFAPFFTIVAD